MKFLSTDLKRVITEPAFFISIALNLILLFGAMLYYLTAGENETLYTSAQALALPFAAPVLAAMPYSVMIMQENETRFGTLMTIKLRTSGYQLARLLTSGLSGALALFIPQLTLFVVCLCIGGIPDLGFAAACLILPITFGFGYAAISYGLTFVNRHRYVPLIMPQVLYLLCIYAFPHLKLERFYPPLDIAPSIYGGEITLQRFAVPLILTVSAILLTLYGKAGDRR
ncbi:MAG: hypothetical protein IJZ61_04325 [Oscillospiraceae bacterium]|nr:hypothetical protein [Oscillospiraceae bacterium]